MISLRSRILTVLAIIVVTVALDQWVKVLATEHLLGETHEYLGGFLTLTHTYNTGAFLSLGSDLPEPWHTLLLDVMPGLLLIGLGVYVLRQNDISLWQLVALSFIIAGGLGNIIDRIRFDKVTDMFLLKAFGLRTGVFNVADMAIMLGMFMMLPFIFKKEERPQSQQVQD